MKEIKVEMRNFTLGVCEEYNVRRILFDISGYRRDFGEGAPVLLVTRPEESQSYPLNLEVDGDYAVWIPQRQDTDIPGTATLVLQWYVEGGLAISTEYYGRILGSKSDSGEVPEAEERWYREVLQAGVDAVSSARAAEAAAEQAETAAGSIVGSVDEAAKHAATAVEAAQQAEAAAEDIYGKMNAAVEQALTKARESGMFDGKSAYEYAVEGGYAGTEEEFAAKLAADIPDDDHINSLIDFALGVIENGSY